MHNKRTYIFGSMVIIVLLVGLFSFRTYKSTDEQEVENTITEFFSAFYTVTPDTIDVMMPNSTGANGENQGIVDYENYAKSTYEGLYTQTFYKTFLVGDRYMVMAPQIASNNNLTISFKDIKLTSIESNDKDKYYDFTVEIVVKDNVTGAEEILVNKGQVSVKQDFIKYKLHAIKFFEDKLVRYLYEE
jgi:hypothetical protein